MAHFIQTRNVLTRFLIEGEVFIPTSQKRNTLYDAPESRQTLGRVDQAVLGQYCPERGGDVARLFWEKVEKGEISSHRCAEIDQKCYQVLRSMLTAFEDAARPLMHYQVLDFSKAEPLLTGVWGSSTAEHYFALNDPELQVHDYFILKTAALAHAFIHHVYRLHVEKTMYAIQVLSDQYLENIKHDPEWGFLLAEFPSIEEMGKKRPSSTPLQRKIESLYDLKAVDASCFTFSYPSYGERGSKTVDLVGQIWEKSAKS